MSFIKKISSFFGDSLPGKGLQTAERQIEAVKKELRLHTRYNFPTELPGSVQLDTLGIGTIHDISYGGIACIFRNENIRELNRADSFAGTLCLFDHAVPLALGFVQSRPLKSGEIIVAFTIRHESADSLVGLREVLEPLRSGSSLRALAPQIRNDRFKGPDWHCFRGEGPVDVFVRSMGDKTAEAFVGYRENARYFELTFKDGVIRTGRMSTLVTDNPLGLSGGMTSSATLDYSIIRSALIILAASPLEVRIASNSLLTELNEKMRAQKGAPAA